MERFLELSVRGTPGMSVGRVVNEAIEVASIANCPYVTVCTSKLNVDDTWHVRINAKSKRPAVMEEA